MISPNYQLRHSLRIFFAAVFIAACAISTGSNAQFGTDSGAKSVVVTEQVRAELMAHAPQGVGPDSANLMWVGLQLAHKPEWHTYWKNSGDSGQPTQLQWTLPAGVTAGDIAWPLPKKIPIGTLANYGFEGTVLLPVPLTISPAFKAPLLSGDIEVKLKAAWLVCKKECIPEEGEFSLKIPVKGSTALNAGVFQAAFDAQPKALAGAAGASPNSNVTIDGATIRMTVAGLPTTLQGKTLDVFPETPEVIETAAVPVQSWQGAVWTATLPLSSQRLNSPAVMPVVLATDVSGQRQGYRAELAVAGTWPAVAPVAGVSPALQSALNSNAAGLPAQPSAPSLTFWAALIGALLGGLILNLMPCVFPVLAIKVVGFTRHADDKRAHAISGLAYTAGVVVSFVALGALMLGLRAAGEGLGWGFQLQSPAVVAVLAALFTVIGLNLLGVFEFGNVLPSGMATLQAKHPAVDSFLSGVLAVAVASPCTAPFMGASLGYAIGLPAVQALLIFATIGLGLALPYLAASLVPVIARALPRPGAWMDTFKKFMAFPMFATVAWLVWVLGQQSGIDGAGALLALLVCLSFVIWALTLKGRTKAIVATISIATLAILTGGIGQNVTKPMDIPTATLANSQPGGWQPWEPGRVDQILAAGQPVFVDFTAAWCVTCQYNKKTTLSNKDVLADLDAKKVVLLRADWTRRDPAITAALQQLGRNGVPVYVVYKPGSAPVVLSEILSVDDIRAVVARL
ncbi:MAG TPA: thioredoxin family protein [Burkholderiaceae bacterium]|nr:thioredoxin family protein [Burkholderiaceae bacterium]